jgi:hypothetical protein
MRPNTAPCSAIAPSSLLSFSRSTIVAASSLRQKSLKEKHTLVQTAHPCRHILYRAERKSHNLGAHYRICSSLSDTLRTLAAPCGALENVFRFPRRLPEVVFSMAELDMVMWEVGA